MITTSTFLRKNKRGSVSKIRTEHYLRDDIWCGSEACNKCEQDSNGILSSKPKKKSSKFPEQHYLLLDTNVILDQIDLFEDASICNVIILRTVLREINHRSAPVYKRLIDIIGNKGRKFHVFANEFHIETYAARDPSESPNDYNDRLIRMATAWYNKHLPDITTVLLTDDFNNLKLAQDNNIPSSSVGQYIESLNSNQNLQELLSKRKVMSAGKGEDLFPKHLTPVQIHTAIKYGEVHQGTFYVSRHNFLEGTVTVDGFDKQILVQGRSGLNRAIDGDHVAVRILPEPEWTAPSDIVLQDEVDPDKEDTVIEKQEELLISELKEEKKKKDKLPTGQIIGIIKRKWRQYCGILQPSTIPGATRHLFVPAEKRIPKVRIETRQSQTLSTQKIVVAIDSWPRNSRYPFGHFVRALGQIGDKETENEVLLLEHDVPHSQFSKQVLSFLPTLPWIITEEDVEKRVDLRHLNICSVDPPGCTDIDDALHCRSLENGHYEVGVHIADVSHFIRPGTALDDEAANRGTTVYLVDKRIDMVPDLLSSNLCSLRGDEERFAFSCIWELTDEAKIVATKFHKSIIRSKRAMTYEEAQLSIDDQSQHSELTESLRNLNKLAKVLKRKRLENGALVLSSPEVRFQVDSETHDPIEVQAKKIVETNSMVEEFMLLANISVAEKIYSEFPDCAMLRRHPEPVQNNFEPLIKAAENQGFKIDTTSGKALAASLDLAVKPDNPYFNTMLRIVATRCMMQAVYFASGTKQYPEFHHYGLAVPIYTHFTSPIRRYADVIVHRLLAACIGADVTYPDLLDKKKSQLIADNLNYRNRMAQYAGRASVALNTHLFMKNRVMQEDGYVLYVRKNALQILVPKYGLEGVVFLDKTFSNIPDYELPEFTYDEQRQTQSCGSICIGTFDPVKVRLSLDTSKIQHQKLVFELTSPVFVGRRTDVEMTDGSKSQQSAAADDQEQMSVDTEQTSAVKNKTRTEDDSSDIKCNVSGNKKRKKSKK